MKSGVFAMFEGTYPQLVASISSTLGLISDGMQYGWTAPIIPILQSPDTPVKISDTDAEFLETIYCIGGVCSLPLTIYMVDKIGRHKSIIASIITSLIAWILIGVANSVEYLYVARFLAGMAGDVSFVATPMYVAEIADQKIRGFLASMIYIMMLVGILLIYAVAPFVPFFVPSVLGVGLLLIQLIHFSFMPESPYYLLGKNKPQAARSALEKLRGNGADNENELKEIEATVERQRSEKRRPQDLILARSNRKSLIITTVLNAVQHFTGISVILMNLHVILEEARSAYMSSSSVAILFAAIMLIAATIASFLVDKYGRVILLTVSSIFSGLCMIILGIYFELQESGYDLTSLGWIPMTSVMIYAAAFKVGLGIVPMVLTAELFSANVKAIGCTIADFSYLVFSLISIIFYQWLACLTDIQFPLFIFGICGILGGVFSLLYIPETKGKSLEEIQEILGSCDSDNKFFSIHRTVTPPLS